MWVHIPCDHPKVGIWLQNPCSFGVTRNKSGKWEWRCLGAVVPPTALDCGALVLGYGTLMLRPPQNCFIPCRNS